MGYHPIGGRLLGRGDFDWLSDSALNPLPCVTDGSARIPMTRREVRMCIAQCEIRLGELVPRDITNLTEFAVRRLAAAGLNPSVGEDGTQWALLAILKGLESDQGGRRPRLMDVETKEAFLNYVRGAISSIIEGMGRKRQFRATHTPVPDKVMASDARTTLLPSHNAELTDLRVQLFSRLRERAPHRLQSTITAWESVFTESDRIPDTVSRRYVSQVKVLAKEIIAELGGIR